MEAGRLRGIAEPGKIEEKGRLVTDTQLLQELEALAERLSIEVSDATLDGLPGGLCKHRGKWRLILDRRLSLPERVDAFLKALARMPLEEVFVVPELREKIDRIRERGERRRLT